MLNGSEMEASQEDSSEARTFRRLFARLCSVIPPELEAVASELYSQGMISDGTRDKAYHGCARELLVDVECKIRTDATKFHDFVAVLGKMDPLRDLASCLSADHRRLSTPTTVAEKMAVNVHRAGFAHERVNESVENSPANNSVPAAFMESVSETERRGLFSGNQERVDPAYLMASPQPESTPMAETSGHHYSSLQLFSGLHERLQGVEEYVTKNCVGRSEAESQAQQIEALSSQLKEVKLELSKKKTEFDECTEDQKYLVRKCRTLETECDVLKDRVQKLEEQYYAAKEQLAAKITPFLLLPRESQVKSHERSRSWPLVK